MVGPGMSYSQMITGEHIASRDSVVAAESGPMEMF
jgi:acetolactate synthase-1/2/3 large subunit